MGNATTPPVLPTRLPEHEVERIYLERTAEEVEMLAEEGFATAGSAFPQVLLVKGRPGAAERAGAELLSGADGDALRAALARLGWGEGAWGALSAYLVREGFPGADPEDLAVAVEVFDPECVIALDTPAARRLEQAWGMSEQIGVSHVSRVLGRRVVALGGFEAALATPQGKQQMWRRLRQVPPPGAPLG